MKEKKLKSLQRVLECAAVAFTQRRFEAVSVNQIAELSHCSTTTIYEVYGSKEKLFLAAISHVLNRITPPRVVEDGFGNALHNLLTYAEARARWLANPDQRQMSRSLLFPLTDIRDVVRAEMEEEFIAINQSVSLAVQACLEQKFLRSFDVEVMTYVILAGTVYEPYVFGLIYGEDTSVDFSELIRKVFTPLVSASGRRLLRNYLENMKPGSNLVDPDPTQT